MKPFVLLPFPLSPNVLRARFTKIIHNYARKNELYLLPQDIKLERECHCWNYKVTRNSLQIIVCQDLTVRHIKRLAESGLWYDVHITPHLSLSSLLRPILGLVYTVYECLHTSTVRPIEKFAFQWQSDALRAIGRHG